MDVMLGKWVYGDDHYTCLTLWDMGRGLGTNVQVTTPDELGFRRGLLAGSFSPDVGRA
ncbi:hypothetical protein Hanom_Chr01g00081801 [Helianthus anomalus]